MKPTVLTICTLSGFLATSAGAADYEIKRTLQLTPSIAQVWNLTGDFCDIDDWHPGISACSLKVIEGKLHRVLTTTGGEKIVERRVASEQGLSYTYTISSSPYPVEKFTATFSVEPIDGTSITWVARFSSDDPFIEAKFVDLIETGLSAIAGNARLE